MRVAAFNVENLFDRARVFNDDDPGAHRAVLEAHAELNALFSHPVYSGADKARMLQLMGGLGLLHRGQQGPYTLIRRIRGAFLSFPRDAAPQIVASGRGDWIGWCELKTEAVNEVAMMMTARVIRDLAADVLAVIEAESRPVLKSFLDLLFGELGSPVPFRHLMLVDGNDPRGIDVGLATGPGYPIGRVRSQVDLLRPDGVPVFSRDCPVYEVTTPSGTLLHVLPNHFKSKFGGNDAASRARRRAQAEATAAICRGLRDAGQDNVIVLGDLNDTPGSAELSPLLSGTDLREATDHPGFAEVEFRANNGQRGIGTYDLGNDNQKIDYLLLSPALFARMRRGGIFRKGAWPGRQPPRWEVYADLVRKEHAASDHHAIWADLDI